MDREANHSHDWLHESVRDVVIGMADGLTVPFALAAGLAGALPATHLVVVAGLAEIAAGCIAMGLGAYLAVKSDHDYFHAELERKQDTIENEPEKEREILAESLSDIGIPDVIMEKVVASITADPQRWTYFTMKYHVGVEHPSPGRARNSSLTIGLSYIVGGLIPLTPYMLIAERHTALTVSVTVTLLALLLFGVLKARFLGTDVWKSAIQTTIVGGLAAAVAFAAARWIA